MWIDDVSCGLFNILLINKNILELQDVGFLSFVADHIFVHFIRILLLVFTANIYYIFIQPNRFDLIHIAIAHRASSQFYLFVDASIKSNRDTFNSTSSDGRKFYFFHWLSLAGCLWVLLVGSSTIRERKIERSRNWWQKVILVECEIVNIFSDELK